MNLTTSYFLNYYVEHLINMGLWNYFLKGLDRLAENPERVIDFVGGLDVRSLTTSQAQLPLTLNNFSIGRE